jgi:hypothetical protein
VGAELPRKGGRSCSTVWGSGRVSRRATRGLASLTTEGDVLRGLCTRESLLSQGD